MKIGWLGAADLAYTRHAILLDGLRAQGVTVVEAIVPRGTPTRARAAHIWRAFPTLRDCDAIFVPAFNGTTAPLVAALAQVYQRPLLVDYLVSLAEVATDYDPTAPARRAFRWLDAFNMRALPAVTDTAAHRAWFAQQLGLAALPRMRVLPVGARDAAANLPPPPTGTFIVQYIGTYIPFHGVEIILQAAARLQAYPHIRWQMIGSGYGYEQAVQQAATLRLTQIEFIKGYFSVEALRALMQPAAVFLGVFGAQAKTDYVVPNKVWEGLAQGRPVITAYSAAVREFFTPGEHLLSVPPADPAALADAVLALASDTLLYQRMALAGWEQMRAYYLPPQIGAQFLTLL